MFRILREDVKTVFERDPAARSFIEVLTCYPGLRAIRVHRFAHWLWRKKLRLCARMLSEIGRFFNGVEIHPGAAIGRRFFIDHGAGVIVGETTIIGDDCTLFQGVTLGGTGKEKGKRHPTLGNGVVVGAGAKILGNIEIGDRAKIGAGSVVVNAVPADCTVVGIPGKVVRRKDKKVAEATFDHANLPDPILKMLQQIEHQINTLRKQVGEHGDKKPTTKHSDSESESETKK